jgi:pimeloyl-ACP methyl ester carboxylesterase
MDQTQQTQRTPWTGHVGVPGAVISYEVHGDGPVLALVGHPMGVVDFRGLARELAAHRTVVLHDPRGFGASPLDDPDDDADPDVLADDLARVLREVREGPVEVLGSSGGAVTALAFAARHPEQVCTVVAHEPPLAAVLPERDSLRAQMDEVVRLLHEQGPGPAFGAFMALAGFGPPPEDEQPEDVTPGAGQVPDEPAEPEQQPSEEDMAAGYRMLAHGLVPICTWEPPVDALRALGDRLVLAGGAESGEQLARRAAGAVAEQVGAELVEMPGDHAPWVERMGGDPAPFAAALLRVLERRPGP